MDDKGFVETFDIMGFFETLEDDDTFVYCYEPQEGREYLMVSDDMGNMPKEGVPMIVACYASNDAFLWQLEFENLKDLYSIYQQSDGGFAFIKKLAELVKN